jgi:hypothetical protein
MFRWFGSPTACSAGSSRAYGAGLTDVRVRRLFDCAMTIYTATTPT